MPRPISIEVIELIEIQDSVSRADHAYDKIKAAILGLESSPKRGRVVPELRDIGVMDYREIFWEPYRIMYLVRESEVFIVAILDGRRDLDDVLTRRLLR